jgi:hypothetical protein
MVVKSIFPLSSRTKWILLLIVLFVAHIIALIWVIKSGADLRQMSGGEFLAFFMSILIFFMAFLSFAIGGGLCILISGAFFIFGTILAIVLSVNYPLFIFLYLLFADLTLIFKLMERIDC